MEPFSSISDRPRDALLLSLHQRELAQKDQKISRLQRANDESLKRAYEAQHRGNRLAQVLGFRDVFEAQMAIDVAGEEISYKECFERVVSLEEEVVEARRVNEELRERVGVLQHEAELGGEREDSEEFFKLQAENKTLSERIAALEADQTRQNDEIKTATSSTISRLEQELKQLQDRYDDLLDVKERAATRYKLDYAKWKAVKEWMFDEETEKDENDEGFSEEEKKRRLKKSLVAKKRMLMEIEEGKVPTPPPLGGIENKENQTPPRPLRTQSPHSHPSVHRIPSLRNKLLDAVVHPKPPSSSPNLFNEGALLRSLPSTKMQEPSISRNRDPDRDPPSSPSPKYANVDPRSSPTVVGTTSKPLRNKLLESVVQKESMSSPTVPNSTTLSRSTSSSSARKPLVFEPVSIQAKQDIESSLTPDVKQHDAAPSSETEEDSQAVEDADPGPSQSEPQCRPRTPMIPTSPAPVLSSETEADSQSQMFSLPFINLDPTPCPARPARPSFTQSQYHQPQARVQIQTGPIPSLGRPASSDKPAFSRDRRVVSSRDGESLRARKMRRVEGEEEEEDEAMMVPERKSSVMEERTKQGKDKESKGKERDIDVEAPSSTPANPPPSTAQKRIEDHSVYKGRGRYGKHAAAPKESINAQFEIDPTWNGGLNFQYDEVVRGRNDRKRMDAGDCECCRDYYEAVGPLPKRLQAPLWRSPPATPAGKSRTCLRHGSGSGSNTNARSHSHLHSHSSTHKRHEKDKENEITSHRQAISRHRHHWDRPKTPPGYWNIGFPDTQETEEINERAREMHRKKREAVEREVDGRRGKEVGRWKRRG